jgi:hypothetical protein
MVRTETETTSDWLTNDIADAASIAGFMLARISTTPVHQMVPDRLNRTAARARTGVPIF